MTERHSRIVRTVFGLFLPAIILLIVAVALVRKLSGQRQRQLVKETATRAAAIHAGPRVQVITVGATRPELTISLLGEVHPYLSTTVYAKVAGYLRDVRVDKGDVVSANQVIGVIESPELEHQYQSAVADAVNKRVNAQRATTLVKRDMISHQDADTAETEAKVADANVAYLATLRSYETLRAPFDGVVTARFADPGALVQNAANSQTSSLPVVTISQIDELRVYVYVPQRDAGFIRVGDRAEIALPDRLGVHFGARVTRTTDELDSKTRTLLTEIDFANRQRLVLPGSFVRVTLRVRAPAYLEVPSTALVMRGEKAFVAVVGPDDRVSLRAVQLGNDDGETAQILAGVKRGDRIALNLGDSASDREQVQPVEGK